MKKTLLLASVAAAMILPACTQDDPVSVNDSEAITFRPSVTRAQEITNSNLEEINVAAFLGDQTFFHAMPFVKGSDGYFTSSTIYNWPGDDSSLDFYSYAPSNVSGTVTLSNSEKTLKGFSPASDLASQIDFITAVASGKRSENEVTGVPLQFNHRLSQIEITAKTDNDAYTYKVTGIRIAQPLSSGDFDFDTNLWTLGTTKGIYEDTYTTPIELGASAISIMGAGGDAMLLPQSLTAWSPESDPSNSAAGTYLAIKLQINTVDGAQVYPFPSNGDCQWAAIPIGTNWEPGKKYIYNLDLTHGAGYVDPKDPDPGKPILGGPIKFTVQVQDWVDTPVDTPMDTGSEQN